MTLNNLTNVRFQVSIMAFLSSIQYTIDRRFHNVIGTFGPLHVHSLFTTLTGN